VGESWSPNTEDIEQSYQNSKTSLFGSPLCLSKIVPLTEV